MSSVVFPALPLPMIAVITSIVLAYTIVLFFLLERGSGGQGRPLIVAASIQLVAGSVLALTGALHPSATRPPLLLLAVLPSILIGAFVLPTLPTFRRAIVALSPIALYLPHTFRVLFGLALLMLASRGALPWQFAEPVGVGDMVVGLTAPLIFLAVRSRRSWARPVALAWNAFGMLDFLQAGLIGFLAGSGPLQRLTTTPSTDILTVLPVALIPTFALVTLYVLHTWSVRSLLAQPSRESSSAVQPRPITWEMASQTK